MKTAIFCFSDAGAALALRLCALFRLPRSCVRSHVRFAQKYGFTPHISVYEDMKTVFGEYNALIFIGACGIAVRAIAPYVRDKRTDPAVEVIDDRGRYVIPLLSGHIGGANALAAQLAQAIGATAVITTATDSAGRFSCDAWAAEHGCAISSMTLAKEVSAEILVSDVPVSSEDELPERLPDGLVTGEQGELGVYIGTKLAKPYSRTLRLIPRTLTVGVGCRRGTSKEAILAAIRTVLEDNGYDLRAVGQLASVDIKKDESGLLEAALELSAKTVFFTAAELNEAQGTFSESEFVREAVGTGCVCERAAVLAGGDLIVKKTVFDGVTVAAARKKRRIEF